MSSSVASKSPTNREMCEILVDVRSVDDHQHAIVGSVDEAIVDDRSVLAEYRRVLRLSRLERSDVVGGDVIHEVDRLWSAHDELAHVAHIEQPRLLTHRLVLGGDSGRILNWHLEPGERDDLGTERDVGFVERGPL